MNNKTASFLLVAVVVSVSAYAQSDSTAFQPQWFISLHSGLLVGGNGYGSSASATLMQGVRFSGLSVGVGTGYDTYAEWQTLPVFAGLGYDFRRRKNHAWFIQVNAGYSKAWLSMTQESWMNLSSDGGYFYHPFIGYRLREGKVSVYFSAGYKLQRLTYGQDPSFERWGTKTTIQREMQRLSVQMGIGF